MNTSSKNRTECPQEPSETQGVPEGRVGARESILDHSPRRETPHPEEAQGTLSPRNPFEGFERGRSVPLRDMPEGVGGAHRQIRKFCLECVGGSPALVRTCQGFQCPLWAWRLGKNPRFVKDAGLLDPEHVRGLAGRSLAEEISPRDGTVSEAGAKSP